MTKMQRIFLKEKKETKERMVMRMNEILDEVKKGEKGYPEAIGAISSCLEIAGWRKEEG